MDPSIYSKEAEALDAGGGGGGGGGGIGGGGGGGGSGGGGSGGGDYRSFDGSEGGWRRRRSYDGGYGDVAAYEGDFGGYDYDSGGYDYDNRGYVYDTDCFDDDNGGAYDDSRAYDRSYEKSKGYSGIGGFYGVGEVEYDYLNDAYMHDGGDDEGDGDGVNGNEDKVTTKQPFHHGGGEYLEI